MEYGYVRVSTKDQNLDRQINAMREAGLEDRNIFKDKASGKDFDRRAYNLLVGTETTAPLLREGDLLTVYSIDRLGRNYTEILKQWDYLTTILKVDIRILDMPLLNTRGNDSNLDSRFISSLVLQILSYVAEKERASIKIRQAQGIAAAREKGKHLGRPKATFPPEWDHVYRDWKEKKITAVEAMRRTNLKRNTFYKLTKEYEAKITAD